MKQLNDQYFTYRQTPVDYDGVARPSIKGNTLCWNQLVQNGNFADTSWWGKVRCSMAVSSNIASLTITELNSNPLATRIVVNTPTLISNHKYLFVGEYKPAHTHKPHITLGAVQKELQECTANVWSKVSSIVTGTFTTNEFWFALNASETTGYSVNDIDQVRNFNIYDLTVNGFETEEQFKTYFPLSYYAYNSGSLLNFNGTGINTTGKNLLENTGITKTVNGVTYTHNSDGSITLTGTSTGTSEYVVNSSFVPLNTVILTGAPTSSASSGKYRIRVGKASDNSFFANELGQGLTLQPLDGGYNIKILVDASNVETNVTFYPMIRFVGADSTFEPYTTSTTSLPISTYFTDGMKSAGTGISKVYDELTDKAITRTGTITFDGTQAPVQTEISSTQCRAVYDVSDIKGKTMTTTEVDYGLTSNYLPNTANSNTYDGQPGIHRRVGGQQQIFVSLGKDSGISNGTEWNAYLSAHPLQVNYELATYTEQSAEDIYYNFYGNGTEQLLPVNADTPSTSPLLADIIYYTVSDSEVPYRVFWAINSKGERWDFTEREFKSFMNNPQGLGFSKTISVNRYGNAQSLTDITDNFPQPNGEVLFYDSHNSTRYDKYNQFVKFLSYEPITLYYKIPVSFYSRIPNTYSLECVVGTLTKTESKTDNMMNCSITYNALSFYKGEEVEISGTGLTYTINNDGDFPVGFEIEINATYNYYMQNPYIQLSQNGSLYGEAKFIDATRFNKVYINSKDGEQNVILQQSGSVLPNPMSYQDLSISNGSIYVTFVKLARGETTLTIGADSQNITDVTIKYTPIYRSV